MLINKRLIGSVSESKPYIAKNIALQWCALAANIVMIGSICRLLERLYTGCAGGGDLLLTAALTLLAVAVRFVCHTGAARMGYLSSKAVKKTLRQNMYRKLLRPFPLAKAPTGCTPGSPGQNSTRKIWKTTCRARA